MIGKAFLALLFGFTLLLPCGAFAASLVVVPNTGTFQQGELVTYDVRVESEQSLNAVGATLVFPPTLYTIESVSTAESILNFWVTEPTFSKSTGTVQFEGVSLTGFSGGSGTVLSITLRALESGVGAVTFESGQILADDGEGTDVTSGLRGAQFTIASSQDQFPSVSAVHDETQAAEQSLLREAPLIRLGVYQSVPAIHGFSDYANAEVLLTFVPHSGKRVFVTGTADTGGNFVVPVPAALRDTPYAATAVMMLSDQTQTEQSEPLTVSGGMVVGAISYQTSLYLNLLALLLLVPLIFYVLWRRIGPGAHAHALMEKEIIDVEHTLHTAFMRLRKGIRRGREDSGIDGEGVALTSEETDLERELDVAEEILEKEIQDVMKAHKHTDA